MNQRKSLCILNINFQRLRKKGKLLEAIILDADPDVILGTETWLDNSIKYSEILPNHLGYDIQRRDRLSDPHGGVLTAAKRCHMLSNIYCSEAVEFLYDTIKVDDKKALMVTSYYRPPNRTDDHYLSTTKEELVLMKKCSKSNIVLLGADFNLLDINWTDIVIQGTQNPTRVNQTFLDIVADNNLEQLVDFPTRKSATLDLIFSSHPSFIERCKPMPSIGNSDHDIVLLDTILVACRPKPPRRKIYLGKRADIQRICEDLACSADDLQSTEFDSVHSMWDTFKEQVYKTLDRRVPTKLTLARHTHPWMNGNIRRLIRRKQIAHKKSDRDRYKRLQQDVQYQVRIAH